jgi:hydroxymethylpyrimidine pyrophosphatase-like HAD family hydrolase
MLFLDHTQVQYCKVQSGDQTLSGLIYNNNLFIREKAFPKEEIEAAIKECREEYLDHKERSQIATLLVKSKNSVGIWMQNNKYKPNIIPGSSEQTIAKPQSSSENSSLKSNGQRISIRQLAIEMHSEQGVEIKTRRHKLTLFQRCFLGNEAVDWIANKVKISREDAIALGQKMLDKGIFQHVTNEHQFKDEPLFYRFNEDRGKSIWNSSV